VGDAERTATGTELAASDAEQNRRLHEAPKEIGVLLVLAGLGGIVLPGPIGTPIFILGGVILWPRAFRGLDAWLERRFPSLHRQGVRQVVRLLDDLDRRYPMPK
jgi:hypothetical protein